MQDVFPAWIDRFARLLGGLGVKEPVLHMGTQAGQMLGGWVRWGSLDKENLYQKTHHDWDVYVKMSRCWGKKFFWQSNEKRHFFYFLKIDHPMWKKSPAVRDQKAINWSRVDRNCGNLSCLEAWNVIFFSAVYGGFCGGNWKGEAFKDTHQGKNWGSPPTWTNLLWDTTKCVGLWVHGELQTNSTPPLPTRKGIHGRDKM